jgi:alanine dehydrogenase
LNNVTLPHTLRIADLGWSEALRSDPHLAAGLNVWNGRVTCEPVADALALKHTPIAKALAC